MKQARKLNGIIPDNMLQIDKTMESFNEYLEELRIAKRVFLDTGEVLPIVRDEIKSSWIRCKKEGDLHIKRKQVYVPEKEFAEILKKNKTLIEVTDRIVESICMSMKQINFVVWLCDANCNIIYLNDEDYFDKGMFDNFDLRVGYCYEEKYAGTNSASLSLKARKNFMVNGPEHYNVDSAKLSCTSALIHGINGNIIGTITITFYTDLYSRATAGMVFAAADLIEKELINISNTRVIDYTLDNISESVLILDARLKIKCVNDSFLKLVKLDTETLRSQDMKQMLREIEFDKWFSGEARQQTMNEMILYLQNNKKIRIKASVFFSYNNNQPGSAVIICQKISDIIQLSHKYTKNTSSFTFDNIITADKHMMRLIKDCRRVASLNHTVLLEGASGTGKELLAQSIHSASPRADKPFIAVNCAALPINLIESELFGYEKGAFSGASPSGKVGKFEMANKGTIFLDEIGELPLDMQAKLLRVLDNSKVTRIGGNIEIELDIRIIAATNRNLYEETQRLHFREDLYYRLNVISFRLPSLSQRRGDIPILIKFFTQKLNDRNDNPPKKIDDEVFEILGKRVWRGNIRELQNAITRAYYLCESDTITKDYFTDFISHPQHTPIGHGDQGNTSVMSKKELERELIVSALKETQGNVFAAGKLVQLSKATMYRKIKQYEINITEE